MLVFGFEVSVCLCVSAFDVLAFGRVCVLLDCHWIVIELKLPFRYSIHKAPKSGRPPRGLGGGARRGAWGADRTTLGPRRRRCGARGG